MERRNRIALLQDVMKREGVEAVLVECAVNRRYLTYVDTSAGVLLVTAEDAVFLVDFRYIEKARKECVGCEVMLCSDFTVGIQQILSGRGVQEVLIERERISLMRYEELTGTCTGQRFSTDKSAGALIEELRKIKDPYELSCFRLAQKIGDEAFLHMLDVIRPGRMESELKMELGTYMVKLGSQNYGMNFITSAGIKTSLPHGGSGDAQVQKGDFVMMDFGGTIDGYSSDMTRTVAVGSVTDEQREVYEHVKQAQLKALATIKPGVTGQAVDKTARDYIYGKGYTGCFGHGLGHSLGLEIHENPRCSEICTEVLRPGMMMTVEPGIYLEGRFGVRIEDMGVVTEDGFDNMTHSDKELIVVG